MYRHSLQLDHMGVYSDRQQQPPLPSEFLERFCSRFENDGLKEIMSVVLTALRSHVRGMSIMEEETRAAALLCRTFMEENLPEGTSQMPANADLSGDFFVWMGGCAHSAGR